VARIRPRSKNSQVLPRGKNVVSRLHPLHVVFKRRRRYVLPRVLPGRRRNRGHMHQRHAVRPRHFDNEQGEVYIDNKRMRPFVAIIDRISPGSNRSTSNDTGKQFISLYFSHSCRLCIWVRLPIPITWASPVILALSWGLVVWDTSHCFYPNDSTRPYIPISPRRDTVVIDFLFTRNRTNLPRDLSKLVKSAVGGRNPLTKPASDPIKITIEEEECEMCSG